jgi:formylglycine-generating enzyme required for sulfatase activity
VKMLLDQADKCAKAGKWTGVAKYCTMANSVAWVLKLPERQTVTARMRDAKSRVMIASRLASLKKAVEKDPADLRSRKRLVETYLIDMNQPVEAAKHLNDKLDETLRANVALAAGKTDERSEAELMTLGQWYRKLVFKTVSKTAKSALLTRASDDLTQFLELHTEADIARVRAASALKVVQTELDKLNVAAAPRSGTSTIRLRSGTLTLNLGKGVTMKLVRIPAGKFVMGSPMSEEGRRSDENPMQQLAITKPFYMCVTEVTQQQYAAVTGENPSKDKGATNPVTHVSFESCQAFCQAMSKITRRRVSMPNDALWEYACRAGTQSPFCFKGADDDLGDYAWFRDNSDRKIHPVGRKKPNVWGLYDMHGNAWELCAAWTSSRQAVSIDPSGPNTADLTVVRGGSINEVAKICRSACTYRSTSGSQTSFRVIVTSN